MVKVTILIPCFNEQETVGEVIDRVRSIDCPFEKEILVIDDGSTDRSKDKIREHSRGTVRLIAHSYRMGKGSAIKTGFREATGDIVVIQDSDMEYFPTNIPRLVEPIISGTANIVYGSRFLGSIKGMSLRHKIGNKVLSSATSLLFGAWTTDVMTGHKAFSVEVLPDIALHSKDFVVELEITAKLLKKGYKIYEMPIPYEYRRKGESKISWLDGFRAFFWLIKFWASSLL